MPEFIVTSPEGERFKVIAPEGSAPEEVIAYARKNAKNATSISAIRKKYPQYDDMSDADLAKALHRKFYSDMDFNDFAQRVGLERRSTGGEIARQVGLTGRHAIEGLASLPAMVAQPVADLGDMALSAMGSDFRFGNQAQGVSDLLSRAGAPEPETAGERVVGDASQVLTAGGGVLGLAQRGTGPLANMLARAPGSQAASSVAGGGAAGVTRETGGSPGAQALAGLGAGVATPAAISGVRNAISARTTPNVEAFRSAGAEPSVGAATNSRFLQGLENLVAKLPGGQGVMQRFHSETQKHLGSKVRTGVTAETAGRTIERGVDKFLHRTKERFSQLDARTAEKIPSKTRIEPQSTVRILGEITSPVVGAESTTAAMVNPALANMRRNLAEDLSTNNGQMPYEALRQLRTRVGSMLDDALVTGVPGGQLKRVYGALSEDMRRAAEAAGAGKEFARQNHYWRARMDRIESTLERVVGKGSQPEDIFRRVNPATPDAVNKLRATLRSLEPAEREVVSRAVIDRLGRATPGRQNDIGDAFSSETFLTNWNRISPQAKSALFPNSGMRADLDKLANVSSRLRGSGQVFANPSGTAGAAAGYTVYGSMGLGALTGNTPAIAAGAGALLLTNVTSRMLTSPRVVNWLASTPSNRQHMAAHIARLPTIYAQIDDEGLREDLAAYAESLAEK